MEPNIDNAKRDLDYEGLVGTIVERLGEITPDLRRAGLALTMRGRAQRNITAANRLLQQQQDRSLKDLKGAKSEAKEYEASRLKSEKLLEKIALYQLSDSGLNDAVLRLEKVTIEVARERSFDLFANTTSDRLGITYLNLKEKLDLTVK